MMLPSAWAMEPEALDRLYQRPTGLEGKRPFELEPEEW